MTGPCNWSLRYIPPDIALNPAALLYPRDLAAEHAADHAVHLVGLVAGVIGALAMVVRAAVLHGPVTLAAVTVYALALLTMLGASAVHNRGRTRAGEELRRRIDHAAIFVMIAGTYTPFTTAFLSEGPAIGATAAVWAAALVGAVVKLRCSRRFERVSVALYLALGWHGLFLMPSLFASLPGRAVILIVAGGVLYSAGVVFYVWKTLPFQNTIWHGFVVLGAAAHYAAIWQATGIGP